MSKIDEVETRSRKQRRKNISTTFESFAKNRCCWINQVDFQALLFITPLILTNYTQLEYDLPKRFSLIIRKKIEGEHRSTSDLW